MASSPKELVSTAIAGLLARTWAKLGWKGKTLLCCVAYLALNLAVVVYGTLSQKPAKPDTVSELKTAAEQPAEPKPSNSALAAPQSAAQPTPPPATPTLDPRAAEAYVLHRRFVAAHFADRFLRGNHFTGQGRLRFSPLGQTRIVRDGNLFRIKGWFATRAENEDPKTRNLHEHYLGGMLWWDTSQEQDETLTWAPPTAYLCELRLDPQLVVWHLSNVELIEQ